MTNLENLNWVWENPNVWTNRVKSNIWNQLDDTISDHNTIAILSVFRTFYELITKDYIFDDYEWVMDVMWDYSDIPEVRKMLDNLNNSIDKLILWKVFVLVETLKIQKIKYKFDELKYWIEEAEEKWVDLSKYKDDIDEIVDWFGNNEEYRPILESPLWDDIQLEQKIQQGFQDLQTLKTLKSFKRYVSVLMNAEFSWVDVSAYLEYLTDLEIECIEYELKLLSTDITRWVVQDWQMWDIELIDIIISLSKKKEDIEWADADKKDKIERLLDKAKELAKQIFTEKILGILVLLVDRFDNNRYTRYKKLIETCNNYWIDVSSIKLQFKDFLTISYKNLLIHTLDNIMEPVSNISFYVISRLLDDIDEYDTDYSSVAERCEVLIHQNVDSFNTFCENNEDSNIRENLLKLWVNV